MLKEENMSNKVCVEFDDFNIHKTKELFDNTVESIVKRGMINPALKSKINNETDELSGVFEKLMSCLGIFKDIDISSSINKEMWQAYLISRVCMVSPDLPDVDKNTKTYVSDEASFGIYFKIIPKEMMDEYSESVRVPNKNGPNEIQIYFVPGILAIGSEPKFESYIKIMIGANPAIEIRPGIRIKTINSKFYNAFETAMFKRITAIIKAIKEDKV
jgi:hypothetical protein